MTDLGRKIFNYGANYVARPIGNAVKAGTDLGNPFSAIGYTLLDLVSKKDSLVNRTAKFAGGITYMALTTMDLIKIAKGDYQALMDLPFNVSMAATLMIDAKKSYKTKSTNFAKDIEDVIGGKISSKDII